MKSRSIAWVGRIDLRTIVVLLAAMGILLGVPTMATAQKAESFFAGDGEWSSPNFSCGPHNADGEVWLGGRFVSEAASIVLLRVDSDGCYLQHVRGPKVHFGPNTWTIRSLGRCTDVVTGLDHVLVAKGVPSNGAPTRQEVWRVRSDLRVERVGGVGGEESLYPLGAELLFPGGSPVGFGDFGSAVVSDDGLCRNGELSVVRQARAALFRDGFSPFRDIREETVRRHLRALASMGEFATVYEPAMAETDGRWVVLLLHLTVQCHFEATVLVRDRQGGLWRAIRDVPGDIPEDGSNVGSTCALTNGSMPAAYFPHVMSVADDRLVMEFKGRNWWENDSGFTRAIDLRTGDSSVLELGITGDAPRRVRRDRLLALVGSD